MNAYRFANWCCYVEYYSSKFLFFCKITAFLGNYKSVAKLISRSAAYLRTDK